MFGNFTRKKNMYFDYSDKAVGIENARVWMGNVNNFYVPVTVTIAKPWPPMCTVRLWVAGEVIQNIKAPVMCDLEYYIQEFRKSWRVLQEKDCTFFPCDHVHGVSDVYCYNKTMLQLFAK